MANGNVKIALLNADLKYVKESQDKLEKTMIAGFGGIKEELKSIKQMQTDNNAEILSAKASIKTLKVVFSVVGALLGVGVTVWAATR